VIAPLDLLQGRLGHWFEATDLLERALTHRSYAHAHGLTDNERLEFLGDAVLQMAVTLLLLERFPSAAEGELSKVRSRLVSRTALAEVARTLELPDLMRLDVGARRQGGRDNDRLLANTVEALLGAVHEDAGFQASRDVVLRLVEPRVEPAATHLDGERHNPVSALQEHIQGERGRTPRYVDLGEFGDSHTPTFQVAVEVDGVRLGAGEGLTKKAARRDAARQALTDLESQS
jgi:ribonuclease-3